MTAETLWLEYCEKCQVDPGTPHSAWSFGGAPDKLADLVLRGIKTATCSWYDLYELDPEEAVPKVGDLSIICKENGAAVCIIKTTRLYKTRFCDVTAAHAFKEGEGDRSHEYWRTVHIEFFRDEAEVYGLTFSEEITLLCEEFEVVFSVEQNIGEPKK